MQDAEQVDMREEKAQLLSMEVMFYQGDRLNPQTDDGWLIGPDRSSSDTDC